MKNWLFIAIVFMGCSSHVRRFKAPENLIPRDEMVSLLTDLVKMEAFIQGKYIQPARYHKVMLNSGNAIFKEHGVTKAQVEKSLEYYGSHQEEMKAMYEEALDRLNKELGAVQSKSD